jgi:hypothetical protein
MKEVPEAPPAARPRIPGARAAQVLLRSLHIVAMALVLGGIARGASFEDLQIPILWTVLTGLLLLILDLARRCLALSQGSGVALLLKLAALGLGNLFPAARLEWYLAATFIASIGSHMPGDWRHFDFLKWRVIESGEKG